MCRGKRQLAKMRMRTRFYRSYLRIVDALLEHLQLRREVLRLGVLALELAPPVHVHRIVELLREGAHLGALVQQRRVAHRERAHAGSAGGCWGAGCMQSVRRD